MSKRNRNREMKKFRHENNIRKNEQLKFASALMSMPFKERLILALKIIRGTKKGGRK